jgi:7-keto-8-aminopelargonate synthetase-like enzyme
MVFTTGYQANLALISTLCGPDDVVLVDVEVTRAFTTARG